MSTKTPREIEEKLEEIKYNFLNYNGVHTKEYMYDFLVTKPVIALLEEARQEMKQYMKNKSADIITDEILKSPKYYGTDGMIEKSVVQNIHKSIQSL